MVSVAKDASRKVVPTATPPLTWEELYARAEVSAQNRQFAAASTDIAAALQLLPLLGKAKSQALFQLLELQCTVNLKQFDKREAFARLEELIGQISSQELKTQAREYKASFLSTLGEDPERLRAEFQRLFAIHKAMQPGQTWYVVSARWFHQWQAYVQLEDSEFPSNPTADTSAPHPPTEWASVEPPKS